MSRKKLIWHFYPVILGVGIVVLLAVAWYAAHSFRLFYYHQMADDLETRARLVEYEVEPMLQSGNFAQADTVCKTLGQKSKTRITLILPDGRVVADSDENPSAMENHSNRPEFTDALSSGSGKAIRFSNTLGKNMMYTAISVKQDGTALAVIRTSIPITQIYQELAKLYERVFWAASVIVVCAAVVSLIISKKLSRPIEDMKETARRFASGDFSRSLSLQGSAELAELAADMNEMARQLKDRFDTIIEEKNRIQAILAGMIEGVIAVDSAGAVVGINKAAADFWGLDESKTLGRNIEEIIRHPRFQQFVQKMLHDTEPSSETDTFVTNKGEKILELHGTSLTGSNGFKQGAVIVMHDITRLHRLEEVRRDFVANVSHELKTPITSIKGFVETLLEGAMANPQETKRFLEIIARHADRLNAIVDDLLTLSRLEEDSENRRLFFELAYIRPMLVSALELSKYKAQEKNISMELICDERLAVKMNIALIEQAVFNLIDNAVKYSPDNSPVKITVQKDKNAIQISVCDKGCGVEEQYLSRIFERFYVVDKSRSRRLGGTGLGLSIVKHIAQVHGGRVTVKSKVNEGSTFTLHLPAGDIDLDAEA
jgi:two-component system phosphate regulon sensor histidine kinase PhoR